MFNEVTSAPLQGLRLLRCTRIVDSLPAADTEEETKHVRLLALLKLFDVFEGALFGGEVSTCPVVVFDRL
jgi:hypothetical protein